MMAVDTRFHAVHIMSMFVLWLMLTKVGQVVVGEAFRREVKFAQIVGCGLVSQVEMLDQTNTVIGSFVTSFSRPCFEPSQLPSD